MSATVRLVTTNVRNLPDLSRAHVRHDMLAVKKLAGIHLWQEIAEDDDRSDLHRVYPAGPFHHVGLATEVPITFNTDRFDVLEHGRRKMNDGVLGLTPDRWATWAIVRHRGLRARGLPPFAVLNTHTVSGAWTPGHDRQELRRELWDQHAQQLAELATELTEDGHTVLGGGDLNHPDPPKLLRRQLWLAHAGLDHLWAIASEHGAQIATGRHGTIPNARLFTDHPALWAAVGLMRP